jgi:putative RNA 2'-phosphotransferase
VAAREITERSKFLSFVLRHRPDAIGLTLDAAGWAPIAELLDKCRMHGKPMTREELDVVVATNPKRRFAVSDDGLFIRASQGHSVEVELGYSPSVPPAVLFHGTVADVVPLIRAEGLKRMSRHHVHLSADRATAAVVGGRRGAPVVLEIASGEMHAAGHVFFVSENQVWLTERVPPEFIAP